MIGRWDKRKPIRDKLTNFGAGFFLLLRISGVRVDADCIERFTEIKLKHCYRYVIYGLSSDLKRIEVKSVAPPTATYDHPRSKLAFFLWSPDQGVNVKQKMLYTSSKDYLRRGFQGITTEIQANDEEDLGWSNVLENLMRKDA
ncbi:DgyrCDS9202 [Dimorphilus gyrociliatus]|uniref:DgyrCDS9202 n=1 Tax=Dimorphilus gyrociliatus TaxID=2664684 RepID=A0A7I8VYP6_9ANNE|nr:DgyrCDS9202 [Dimorphilus gyrociliatus]